MSGTMEYVRSSVCVPQAIKDFWGSRFTPQPAWHSAVRHWPDTYRKAYGPLYVKASAHTYLNPGFLTMINAEVLTLYALARYVQDTYRFLSHYG